MNPELQRNLWLELTLRRMLFMAVVVLLIFFAAHAIGGQYGLALAAEYLFYAITVVWGARNAAQSVVGEIRDRTWDSQRLSALTPFAMIWGKLLGATSYAWFGGLMCLAVLLATAFSAGGAIEALSELCYFLAIGLMAQSVALFASLLAVRRRQAHSRLDVFFYQLAGLVAAWGLWSVWGLVSPVGGAVLVREDFAWWAMALDSRVFYLVSLLVFLAWAVFGCYRLMRLELQMQNSPTAWIGFMVFMAVYMAGFDAWGAAQPDWFAGDGVATRLHIAALTLGFLTYLAVAMEPKDRVLYRWLADAMRRKKYAALLGRLQAWMIAYAGTIILVLIFVVRVATVSTPPGGQPGEVIAVVLAALGFVTRDLAIFLLFHFLPGQRRGELPALITLAMLYGVAPQIAGLTGLDNPFFYPVPAGWQGPVISWMEAAVAWGALVVLDKRAKDAALPAGS